ncbi:MAG: holo-ACP synthase [Firmicutes bacterium]|nr:holo-ACP synthase [Bacillota bacterium]
MIGVDIIEIERVQKAASKEPFVKGTFTTAEMEYYHSTGSRAETLAGFFCAKEAVAKASGRGIRGFKLTDIEVLHTELGQPYVVLHGEAAKLFDKQQVNISISHNKTTAVAFCTVVNE